VKINTVLENLIGFFAKEKIDFALIGAFALQAYGYVRATGDIDFILRGEDQESAVRFLESLGYETLYRSKGFSNHVHPLTVLGRIDFIYVEGETAEKIFSGTKPLMIFEGIAAPVVRPAHLIALKVFAMKNDPGRSFREMADIQQLMNHTSQSVDIDETRGTLKNTVNWRSSMSLQEESKKSPCKKLLDLESGLPLTPEDFRAMKRCVGGQPMDLAGYVMWLEQIGAFKTGKADAKIYPERFEL
jgi:hypothetical protein